MEKEQFAMSIEVYEIVLPVAALCWGIGVTLYTRWEGNRLDRKRSVGQAGSSECHCCE